MTQALLVTLLWSTSWILVKVGLDDLNLQPISFAGLRYAAAALVLLPFAVRALGSSRTGRPSSRLIALVGLYGLLFVAVAQGAQFAALSVLPATTVNLVLASIPVWVALISMIGVHERASAGQIIGIAILGVGAVLFFGRLEFAPGAAPGMAAALVCALAAAASVHLGRGLARDAGQLGGPGGVTALSMATGGVALLGVGIWVEGWPRLAPIGWLIVAWLALVNTAFAFTLWTHALRTLTAVEASVINNTMLIQIAVLAVIFLDERLSAVQVVGLLLAAFGALAVQLVGHHQSRPSR